MSSMRTAWHPPFTTAMRERGPRWVKNSAEVQRTEEPHRADDVIENNGRLEDLEPRVLVLHRRYLEIAAAMAAGSNTV